MKLRNGHNHCWLDANGDRATDRAKARAFVRVYRTQYRRWAWELWSVSVVLHDDMVGVGRCLSHGVTPTRARSFRIARLRWLEINVLDLIRWVDR